MNVFKFAKFLTTQEFEEWQRVKERQIHNIIPIAFGVAVQSDVEALCNFGVLVTYMEFEDNEDKS